MENIKKNELSNKDFYFCYDGKKASYFKNKGFRWITQAKASKSDQEFWLFHKNSEFMDALHEFNAQFINYK